MAEENENWLMRWKQFPTLWTKIKSLVSAAVSTEATRAKGIENSLSESIKTLVETISAEVTRAKTAEDTKADKSTTYTKTETDNLLTKKANTSDVYTKTEANNLLAAKATTTALSNEAKARADKDDALEDAINTQAATTTTKLAEVLQSAKDYADSKVTGMWHIFGDGPKAEMLSQTTQVNGDVWIVTDENNSEYYWNGGEWRFLGRDIDWSALQEDINSRAKQSDLTTEINRAKAAEKANSDAIALKANDASVVHTSGDETIRGTKTFREGVLLGQFETMLSSQEINGGIRRSIIRVFDKNDSTRYANFQVAQMGDGRAELCLTNKSGYIGAIKEGASDDTAAIANNSYIIPTGSAVYNWVIGLGYLTSSRAADTYMTAEASKMVVKTEAWTKKGGVVVGTGGSANWVNWWSSDYIAVIPGAKISFYGSFHVQPTGTDTVWNIGAAWYNADKKYVSGINGNTTTPNASYSERLTLIVPANCYYLRYTKLYDLTDEGVSIYLNDALMAVNSNFQYITDDMINSLT